MGKKSKTKNALPPLASVAEVVAAVRDAYSNRGVGLCYLSASAMCQRLVGAGELVRGYLVCRQHEFYVVEYVWFRHAGVDYDVGQMIDSKVDRFYYMKTADIPLPPPRSAELKKVVPVVLNFEVCETLPPEAEAHSWRALEMADPQATFTVFANHQKDPDAIWAHASDWMLKFLNRTAPRVQLSQ